MRPVSKIKKSIHNKRYKIAPVQQEEKISAEELNQKLSKLRSSQSTPGCIQVAKAFIQDKETEEAGGDDENTPLGFENKMQTIMNENVYLHQC